MLKLTLFVTLGSVLAVVLADEEVNFCDNLTVMKNLDLTKLKGPWWEWAGSGTIKFLLPHTCHVSNFYPSADGKSITSLNDYETVTKDFKEQHVKYSWKITDESPANDGTLKLQIETQSHGVTTVPFLVLDTDYDKYLIVYMCKDGPHLLHRFRSALILTRKTSWKEDELKEIDTKVDAALAKNDKTREVMGLVHSPILVKDCEMPEFPDTLPSNPGTNAPAGSVATPNSIAATPTGSTASSTGLSATPTGYAAPPTGYAAPPTGYAAPPTGYAAPPTGYAAPPTGYAAPPNVYTAAPTDYTANPTGYTDTFTGYTPVSTGYTGVPTAASAYSSPGGTSNVPVVNNYNGVNSSPLGFGRPPPPATSLSSRYASLNNRLAGLQQKRS